MTYEEIVQAVEDADLDPCKATARKSGRNTLWPYVPVVRHLAGNGRDEQVLGLAFETREEAVVRAVLVIVQRREALVERLADPRMRALREQHGLPRELTP